MSNDNDPIRQVDPKTLGLPEQPVDDVDEARKALGIAMHSGANVIGAPLMEITHLPPNHAIDFRVIFFDPRFTVQQKEDKSNGTWYITDGDKAGLHRSALDMIASAAGITTVDSQVERVGPYIWNAKHTVRMKGLDGRMRTIVRSKELDLSDEATKGWKDKRRKKAREHGAQNAETKSANRAIRAMMGIKGGFTWDEAKMPFVFPVLLWQPPVDDPIINRMMAAKELGIVGELFGAMAEQDSKVIDTAAEPVPETKMIADNPDLSDPDAKPREKVPADGPPTWAEDENPKAKMMEEEPPMGPQCANCKAEITVAVHDYSVKHFRKPLCRGCQREARG